jgi:hypothetical protein
MSLPRRCNGLIPVLLKEINRSTTGAPIRRFTTPVSRLYLACYQAALIESEQFPAPIFEWREKLGDTMREAGDAHERGNIQAEREHVNAALDLYRKILGKIDELGLEEPQTLTVTFNNLLRRHNELNPDQSQGRQP